MTVANKTSFVPLAPVQLVKPNGQVLPFGLGASTDTVRGTALLAALAIGADEIRLGPGIFDVGTTLIDIPASVALRGRWQTGNRDC